MLIKDKSENKNYIEKSNGKKDSNEINEANEDRRLSTKEFLKYDPLSVNKIELIFDAEKETLIEKPGDKSFYLINY